MKTQKQPLNGFLVVGVCHGIPSNRSSFLVRVKRDLNTHFGNGAEQ